MAGAVPNSGGHPLAKVLDALIAMAQAAAPDVEFGLHVSGPTSLLMPSDDSRPRLWRSVEGRTGYHHSAAYRHHEIVPDEWVPDHVVSCVALRDDSPGSATAEPYYADLNTGEISRTYSV